MLLFFYEQKTSDEMRISDWSSDVCSSDLLAQRLAVAAEDQAAAGVAVEPVGETRRPRQAEAQHVEALLHVDAAAGAGMHRHSRRLVEHQHQAVAVEHPVLERKSDHPLPGSMRSSGRPPTTCRCRCGTYWWASSTCLSRSRQPHSPTPWSPAPSPPD